MSMTDQALLGTLKTLSAQQRAEVEAARAEHHARTQAKDPGADRS